MSRSNASFSLLLPGKVLHFNALKLMKKEGSETGGISLGQSVLGRNLRKLGLELFQRNQQPEEQKRLVISHKISALQEI